MPRSVTSYRTMKLSNQVETTATGGISRLDPLGAKYDWSAYKPTPASTKAAGNENQIARLPSAAQYPTEDADKPRHSVLAAISRMMIATRRSIEYGFAMTDQPMA